MVWLVKSCVCLVKSDIKIKNNIGCINTKKLKYYNILPILFQQVFFHLYRHYLKETKKRIIYKI